MQGERARDAPIIHDFIARCRTAVGGPALPAGCRRCVDRHERVTRGVEVNEFRAAWSPAKYPAFVV
jgi:hypothetical protein